MDDVKTMRANMGMPGGMPKTHLAGPNLNHKASAMKDALSQRRKTKIAKAKMLGQNQIKQGPGTNPDEALVDTSFMEQAGE